MDRVQRKRTKGSKLPPHTLVVTRGTRWGNPFKAENEADKDRVVIEFTAWIKEPEQNNLIRSFVRHCEIYKIQHIACFCGLYSVCHGDIWLDVWNTYQNAPVPFEMIGWDGKART